MKKIRVIDEDTLEIKEVIVKEDDEKIELTDEGIVDLFEQALNGDPDEFAQKYRG